VTVFIWDSVSLLSYQVPTINGVLSFLQLCQHIITVQIINRYFAFMQPVKFINQIRWN
jgi:hypothetical protein